ncbi:MAG: DNA repair protein RadA [Candidatus Wallacebacter cryptica]|jgi:DNA repair protein RadA/Sms|nr:DNA repair protein RadA [Bacillota bacterium]
MAKASIRFVCQNCGADYPKWMGRCSDCGEWNTIVEERTSSSRAKHQPWVETSGSKAPVAITEVVSAAESRSTTGMAELDRVLGGGIVPGSLGLLGGEPGVGKSTLLMQVAAYTAVHQGKVLYVSGEESLAQLKLRAQRLGLLTDQLIVLAESDAHIIGEHIESLQPKLVLIDSIQTMYLPDLNSAPGSVAQVREGAAFFLKLAKGLGIPIILVGHVTKGGSFAGPKVLEHAVDYVLYFEGENQQSVRIIRGVKNRFGSTNEVGIFDMTSQGLVAVDNPSGLFLAERPVDSSGSVVVPCIEGTRPLLVEIQALVAQTPFSGTPRRQATGVDYQRFSIILAVLEKRQGYHLQTQDVFVNVAGGFKLTEPGVDLGIACAVASSYRNRVIPPELAVIGEVGLSGEIRGVSQIEARLKELAKLGFKRAVIPAVGGKVSSDIKVTQVKTISAALEVVFS